MELYTPFKSFKKNKKYSVLVDDEGIIKLIHFGDTRYEQYFDQIGLYSELDHLDTKRRNLYFKRATKIKRKGKLSYRDITSPNYWSINFLW
jgi:hypothetical protein